MDLNALILHKNYSQCPNTYSFQAALHVHAKHYIDDGHTMLTDISLFPKMYTLITFYQRI